MHLNQLYVGVQKTQGRIDLHKNILTFLAKKKKTGNHYQSLDIWANVMKKSVVFFRLKNVMFNYCIWFNCNQQCFQIKLHCIQRTQIMLSAYALQPNCLFYIACSRQQHSIKWLVFNLSLSLSFLYSLSFQNNQLIL